MRESLDKLFALDKALILHKYYEMFFCALQKVGADQVINNNTVIL